MVRLNMALPWWWWPRSWSCWTQTPAVLEWPLIFVVGQSLFGVIVISVVTVFWTDAKTAVFHPNRPQPKPSSIDRKILVICCCIISGFRALSREDNILLHTVQDYFSEEDFTKCCTEMGIDASYAKHVSISRLKGSICDNFWSETMV